MYAILRTTNKPNLRKWQKKPSFRPDFGPFHPNLGPQFFFRGFYLYQVLGIIASYCCKLVSGPILAFLPQIRAAIFFFFLQKSSFVSH